MLRADALEYVARSVVRQYGSFPPRFIENVRRNVRRNFRASISAEQVREFMAHYQRVYAFAAAALPRFLGSSNDKSARGEDVRLEEFRAHVAERYQREPQSVIETVTGYAVFYEYLK